MTGKPSIRVYGEYDFHPAEGVERPFAAVIEDFRLILLKNCGHLPWIKTAASDRFYAIRREELWQGKDQTD
jgi:hypothetical protein